MQTAPAPSRRRLIAMLCTMAASATTGLAARAQARKPTGKVVLSITGHVDKPNNGQQAQFDMAMLEALPQITHVVETPWYPRKVSLRGPLLRDVLAAAGATGTRLRAVAINDYAVEIPFSDTRAHDVILALSLDGKAMSPRDKGPLFIVYPYQKIPPAELKTYHDRSVWQLASLQVL